MTASQKKVFYQELWRSFTRGAVKAFEQAGQKVEVKALDQRPISVGGREGLEQDFTVGPLRGRARMVLSGQHAYALMALWAEETAEGQTATFFNSLQLREP